MYNSFILAFLSEFSTSSSSKLNLSIYLLKFNSLKILYTSFLFHSSTLKFSNVSSIGTSKFISPKNLDNSANSLLFSKFSFCFPFISVASPASNFLYKFSIV